MGQYYKPVNIDRQEWLLSHDYDNDLKLMEHSYVGNGFVSVVEQLLASSWKGDRIVWAGDYAEPEKPGGDNVFHLMTDERKIVPTPAVDGPSRRYILNHDRKLFVDIETAPINPEGYRIHPLPLLTAEGNGRGGGDFRRADPRVGQWARQRLEMADTVPTDYVEMDGIFIE